MYFPLVYQASLKKSTSHLCRREKSASKKKFARKFRSEKNIMDIFFSKLLPTYNFSNLEQQPSWKSLQHWKKSRARFFFWIQILTWRDGFCNEVNFHFSSTNGTTQADDVEELELFSIHFHRVLLQDSKNMVDLWGFMYFLSLVSLVCVWCIST